MDDLKFNGSYWEKFAQEIHCHLDSKFTKFWEKGFEILQNIHDRLTLEKEIKRAKDPIFVTTVNEKPMKTDCEEIDFRKHTHDTDDILQMGIHSRYVTFKNVTFVITKLFYYSLITNFRDNNRSDDDGDYNFDKRHEELSHPEIIDRCKFNHGHLINARLSSNRSLLQEEMLTDNNTKTQDLNPTGTDNVNVTQNINKTYSTMLKFISGA